MPRLLDLALTPSSGRDPFVFPYLLALTPSPEHRRLDYFDPEQRSVVLESLVLHQDRMRALVEGECCESDLSEAIVWQTIAPDKSSKRTPNGAA